MKKFTSLLIIPLILLTLNTKSQQASDVEDGIFKINFLPLSFSYEKRVGHFQTMMLEPGMGLDISNYNEINYINFSPSLGIHYRYYYNINKRNFKEKRTSNNSANFVGVYAKYTVYTDYADFAENQDAYKFMTFGPVWGIQRNYRKHFSLGLLIGPAISIYPGRIALDGIFQLTLGFHFGK